MINTAPDQEVSLEDGGSGNVTIGGEYPNFTIDVPIAGDADSDPENENQTVSGGEGISINQVDQDFEVTNTQPDQVVTIADGGSGNVAIGGSYPNFTIDVPSAEDADSDPTNENQTVSAGTGISINQVDQDFEVINTEPDQEVTLADGGSGNVAIGGSYPNFTIDVPSAEDADSDPTNENQTVSAGTGISINQVDQDFEVTNTEPDQVVTIQDAGSGTITVGGSYPNFTLDVPAGEASLSNLTYDISFRAGADRSLYVEDSTASGSNLMVRAGRGLAGVGGDLNLSGGMGSSNGGNINLQAGTGSTNGVINLNSEVNILGPMFRMGSFFTVDGIGHTNLSTSSAGTLLNMNHSASGGDALAINITGAGNAINVGGGAFTVDKEGNTATEHIEVAGNAKIAGAQYVNTRTITGTFGTATVQPDDYLIVFDGSAASGTINLPPAPESEVGRALKFITIANSTESMTIRADGTGTIIGNGSNLGSNTYPIRHDGGGPWVFAVEMVQIATDMWLVTSMSINNPD